MRVLGVNLYSNSINKSSIYKRSLGAETGLICKQCSGMPIVSTKSYIPSFGAYITTPGEFRNLTKRYFIHCPYCKKPMFYGGTLDKMLKQGVFSGPVKDFVEAVEPYKKTLKRGHKFVFGMISKYADKNPQTHLSEIIQLMYTRSIRRLVKRQSQIFKELVEAAEDLPQEMHKPFREFMKTQHKRLYEIPYNVEFNGKPFSYKIKKMSHTINSEETKRYLINITEPLADPIFKDLSATVPEEIVRKITRGKVLQDNTAGTVIRYVIDTTQRIGERFNRRDMIELCKTSRKMVDGQPVVVTFSNKEFLHDLVKHQLDPIKKTPLYYKIMDIAKKLPTSDSNMNSFIVKHKFSDSDTIGYKLIEPSVTTIEHIKPRSKNGVDSLENMALACKADNNERQNIPQYIYLKKWPAKNPQIYFNDIIDIANEEHLIKPSTVRKMAASFLEEGNVSIDIAKLKG